MRRWRRADLAALSRAVAVSNGWRAYSRRPLPTHAAERPTEAGTAGARLGRMPSAAPRQSTVEQRPVEAMERYLSSDGRPARSVLVRRMAARQLSSHEGRVTTRRQHSAGLRQQTRAQWQESVVAAPAARRLAQATLHRAPPYRHFGSRIEKLHTWLPSPPTARAPSRTIAWPCCHPDVAPSRGHSCRSAGRWHHSGGVLRARASSGCCGPSSRSSSTKSACG
jgi:hypothetical protein